MPDPRVIRERYCATAPGYDELYSQEQREKYKVICSSLRPRGVLADIGAGTCLFEEFLTESGLVGGLRYVVALDLTDCMLELCRARLAKLRLLHLVDIVVADAEHLPLRSKCVDVSVAVTVFDLAASPEAAIREMVRVTRGRGVYTLLRRVEARRLYSLCEVYLGETDKDVVCSPRALHERGDDARVSEEQRV